ncbi:hypothetical protein SOV_02380 [Sporomusa ovata DSM 2662]|uniref:Uncharacterized protein n=1 Tax=Sporomusa ovata TaxID=2378 RepID=A0A0U1L1S7_9FIRM|nr:hypothetical protein [Sporomusa ovata]EQB27919.1 hypothetical protein SOV_2c08300 [Sporomusa ovata DSM 2662]CQR72854.1 hypothetical protein SpAn4DRAFT_3314 [Sporomusa ovata]
MEKAADFSEQYQDAYQAGIIIRAKLEVRIQMQQDIRVQEAFADYLNLSCEEYYRQGKELFGKPEIQLNKTCWTVSMQQRISNKDMSNDQNQRRRFWFFD